MLIRGVEVECNMGDIQKVKIYEVAQKELLRILQDPETKNKMMYEQAELYSSNIVNMITELFGEEASNKIIPNKNDYMICVDALVETSNNFANLFKEIESKMKKYDLSRIQ